MNNNQFYAFCRDQRRSKDIDDIKRNALQDLYDFMRNVGSGRRMVNMYIEERITRANTANQPNVVAAYQWLYDTFDKPAPPKVPQEQGTLL